MRSKFFVKGKRKHIRTIILEINAKICLFSFNVARIFKFDKKSLNKNLRLNLIKRNLTNKIKSKSNTFSSSVL